MKPTAVAFAIVEIVPSTILWNHFFSPKASKQTHGPIQSLGFLTDHPSSHLSYGPVFFFLYLPFPTIIANMSFSSLPFPHRHRPLIPPFLLQIQQIHPNHTLLLFCMGCLSKLYLSLCLIILFPPRYYRRRKI